MPVLITPALPAGTLASSTQPEISGDGLSLRSWREEDRAVVVTAHADPAIQRWHCKVLDDDEAAMWIADWARRWQDESAASWAVVTEGGAVAGQIGLRRVDLVEGAAHISYWVLPEFRGRRVAPRALDALTRWAFGEVGLHRLELNHSTRNAASCRVAVQAGYQAEGTKRSEARHADDWHDMHQHARLATD